MKKSDIQRLPVFFDRYIHLSPDVELMDALEQYSPERTLTSIEQLAKLGDRVYAEGKWTVKDILQHLIDTERVMCYRAMRVSRLETTPLPGFEENIMAANSGANQRELSDLMAEYKVVREGTIHLFKPMTPTMLMAEGLANGSSISVLALGFVIVGHLKHHQNIIQERYMPLLTSNLGRI
ncbi:DinB family protein [Dyadobacter jejuensis]|uniref:DinB family protein n=1 Tax=Dyadobacter jejuensis TaxID=1082580 RepID=A0A316AIA5_9BACT|nr:DinB family protein [Dyadobacter jejuensis]PWJ57436.1 DinB family protein [Dyadobacter jejuensis]